MSNRPGFVSAAGITVAAVLLVGIVGFTLLRGPVLFSPGPLNAVAGARTLRGTSTHAQLAADCEACHSTPWNPETMTEKCLGCHEDIAAQMKNGTTPHGRLMGKLSSPTCRGCHTEHHGSNGALTVTDPATFPHNLTGFSLRGHEHKENGTRFACKECHPKDIGQFDQATCAECHAKLDPDFMAKHEAEFGKACLLCHNGTGRHGSDFDHNKLSFKLTGKHAGVACGKCHSNLVSLAAPKTPRDCNACHAKDDEHKGTFGTQCDQCHSVNGWGGAKFDHKVFPINHGNRGKPSPCTTCHPTTTKTYTCYGCHEHTLARAQAEHRKLSPSQLADCIRCHKGGRGGD